MYVPALFTVIDCPVEPFDHVLPDVADEVNVTEFPEQNVVGPPAVIVGVAVELMVTFWVELTEPLIVRVIVFEPGVE